MEGESEFQHMKSYHLEAKLSPRNTENFDK